MAPRKLVVEENVSCNGVVEFIDDWFAPDDQGDPEQVAAMQLHMQAEAVLLLGRGTFEDFRGYWPLQVDEPTGTTHHLNKVQKYVLSRTMRDAAWENTIILRGSLEAEVTALKAQGGGDIGVTGSISVVHDLMRADLVDEYRLWVYPFLTSRGRNLVPEGMSLRPLHLVATRSFRSGVTLLTYRKA